MTSPGTLAMSDEEWVDVVDLDDRVVGSLPRREIRAGGRLHRATSILVTRSDGEVFVPWDELARMLATLRFCPDSREIVQRGGG